ncbi:MAG: GTP 3',8-cyclase MoaA [Proteobacteria bacterium]|nr:GTP 3',8-cyclase MoaA [Pseudomonadota bacterium]
MLLPSGNGIITRVPPPAKAPLKQLLDNHGRVINYLRLSITDRCNLRCRYCRPEKGVPFIPHAEILSFEELERLAAIFCALGVEKVRVTGGEPFSRRGCLPFLQRLKKVEGLQHLHITTNGVKTSEYLDDLASIGLGGINLSLDTVDPKRFWRITRRDYLDPVIASLNGILERGIPLKINSVFLDDTSDAEIVKLVGFAEKFPVTVRFIEKMPFSGSSRPKKLINSNLSIRLKNLFPTLEELSPRFPTTARTFLVKGFPGKLGIIEGYSRLFCHTCNKVRITPTGLLKTCLYDNGVLDLKKMLREGTDDEYISKAIKNCIQNRFINGHEAELYTSKHDVEPSMASIGG